MTDTELVLPGGERLTSLRADDVADLVRLLGDGEVAQFIPPMPQPYTRESAETWVRHRREFRAKVTAEVCFAIRSREGPLLGSIGVDDLVPGKAHNGELGYWLGREHRGRGLGRAAATRFVRYAFETLGLGRLTAHALHFNEPSIKLLEDLGFQREGRLRDYARTASGVHDVFVFGLLRTDPTHP